MNRKDFTRQIEQAAEMGIAMVGKRRALNAALKTQHILLTDLFKLTHGVIEHGRTRGKETPVLPMTDEVIEVINNALGSTQMVAQLMVMGCLDEERDPSDMTYDLDHSYAKSGTTKH